MLLSLLELLDNRHLARISCWSVIAEVHILWVVSQVVIFWIFSWLQEVDIWSYGCLLYELLTLQMPYSGQSEAEIYSLLQVSPVSVIAW